MFSQDVGIDLGTANTLVHLSGKGIVLREPSVVAIQSDTGQVLAVGEEAKKMIGRTPGNIIAIRPVKDGVIADFDITAAMLRYFIRRATGGKSLIKPRVMVGIPSSVTDVEKRAVIDATLTAGARDAYLIEEPMAAAIGAGVDIAQPHGTMVVDIGEGTTDMAVISLSGIAKENSIHLAGADFNEAIVKYVRRKFDLVIGNRTAEACKIAIGCAYPRKKLLTYTLKGRNALNGLPVTGEINSDQIIEALIEPSIQIIRTVQETLEATPPEMLSDIFSDGIYLTGGSAGLYGLSTLLSKKTKIPVVTFENPENCVVLGAGQAIQFIDKMDNSLRTKNPLVAYYNEGK